MQDDILNSARGLHKDSGGLWVPRLSAIGTISYPDSAHTTLREIEDLSYWFAHRNRCIASLLRRLPPEGTLLEIGSGNGAVSAELARQGFKAVPLEPSREGSLNALLRGLDPVLCSTVEAADFAPGSLSALGLFDVLEHIEDEAAFLSTLLRIMRKGARLYLTVPAYGFLWSEEDERAGHYRRYSKGSLIKRIHVAGLQVEYATHFMSALPLPIVLMRSLPYRLGLRRPQKGERMATEHTLPKGIIGNLMEASFRWETGRISALKSIPFGSSLLVSARKP